MLSETSQTQKKNYYMVLWDAPKIGKAIEKEGVYQRVEGKGDGG